jgi:predicted house-cleaning NTP pyrophosphatase (Maf/HAM1 superfamily)
MTPIVLASSSKYRRQLLEKLGLDFISCGSDVDESRKPGELPEVMVSRLSIEKAAALTAPEVHGRQAGRQAPSQTAVILNIGAPAAGDAGPFGV